LMIMVTVAAAAGSAVIPVSITRTSAQAPPVSATALKTPWGETRPSRNLDRRI
jgi:hypothetical protein